MTIEILNNGRYLTIPLRDALEAEYPDAEVWVYDYPRNEINIEVDPPQPELIPTRILKQVLAIASRYHV
jgi:hypothetical protein